MYVNSDKLRQLRLDRQWTQEQLASISGLNLRTIQRLESGAKISKESLRSLSAVLEVPAESLLVGSTDSKQSALKAIRDGVLNGLEFKGTTVREDFWWFFLAVVALLALARLFAEALGPLPVQLASLIVLVPLLAAIIRRLRDAQFSPWWLLMGLVPVVGVLFLLYLLTYPTKQVQIIDPQKQP